jgi:phosphatidylinositol phospholipase C delta
VIAKLHRNYQTGTEPMWLNDGKFLDNANCGYILKPAYMREKEITFNPETPGDVKRTLIVNVRATCKSN